MRLPFYPQAPTRPFLWLRVKKRCLPTSSSKSSTSASCLLVSCCRYPFRSTPLFNEAILSVTFITHTPVGFSPQQCTVINVQSWRPFFESSYRRVDNISFLVPDGEKRSMLTSPRRRCWKLTVRVACSSLLISLSVPLQAMVSMVMESVPPAGISLRKQNNIQEIIHTVKDKSGRQLLTSLSA